MYSPEARVPAQESRGHTSVTLGWEHCPLRYRRAHLDREYLPATQLTRHGGLMRRPESLGPHGHCANVWPQSFMIKTSKLQARLEVNTWAGRCHYRSSGCGSLTGPRLARPQRTSAPKLARSSVTQGCFRGYRAQLDWGWVWRLRGDTLGPLFQTT